MEFLEMARKRYSVRRFDASRKVGKEIVERILEAARTGPSAHNFQSWRVLVIEEEDALARLKSCTPCHYHAPLAFVISYDSDVCWKRESDKKPAGEVDAVIAAVHMMFEACEQGIGSCFVMGFDEAALKEQFHLPEQLKPTAILVCGYPSTDCRPSSRHGQRKPLNELVAYNDYEKSEGE